MSTDYDKEPFDFSDAVKVFAPYLDESHPDFAADNEGGMEALLSMPCFNEYLVYYFERDFMSHIAHEMYIEGMELPRLYPEIKLAENYRTFYSALDPDRGYCDTTDHERRNKIKHVRSRPIYPLTYEETEKGLFFMQQNDDFVYAVTAVQACLVQYLDRLKKAAEETYGFSLGDALSYQGVKRPESAHALALSFLRLTKNAAGFTIPHDLLVPLSAHMSKHEEPFSKHAIMGSIKEIFKRGSFSSGQEGSNYMICPFKNATVNILRTGLVPISKNSEELGIVENQPNGQLLLDVRNIIRTRYFQAWVDPAQKSIVPRHSY